MTTIPIISIPVLPGKNGSEPRYLKLVDWDAWDAIRPERGEITQEELDRNPVLKLALECPVATEEQIAEMEAAIRYSRGH